MIMHHSLFWKATKSYHNWEFVEAMNGIKKESNGAYKWLTKIPPQMWFRQAFDPNAK